MTVAPLDDASLPRDNGELVFDAPWQARALAIAVALTGAAGLIDATADFVVAVPSAETASIQEVHLMLLHAWCQGVDKVFA